MTDALNDLIAKYELSLRRLPEGVSIFKGVEGAQAARMSAESVIEQILGDLRAISEDSK